MSASRDTKSAASEATSVAVAKRAVPVRLARRGGDAHSQMLSRVLPDSGVSRLDVAAFNSSI